MLRSRVWLLTTLATFLVAGPVLAYWPVLFGVPAVFGQECPRAAAAQRVMPYADGAAPRARTNPNCESSQATQCDLLADCLAAWRRLWQQGRFKEAYELAKCAAQAAPDSADARHALAVSQLVMETQASTAFRTFAQQQLGNGTVLPPAELPQQVTKTPVTATTALTSATPAPVRTVSFDIECDLQCPLTSFLASVFGGRRTAKVGCDACPATGCCEKANNCCKQAAGQSGCCSERMVRGQHGPSVIYIVREPVLTTVPSMPQAVAYPSAPLPPPIFAVPPPPFVSPEEGTAYIPVPVPTAPAQPGRPVLFDPAEQCDAVCPVLTPMPAGVQIAQHGRRVQMISGNYRAECDRIRGGANGQLILEGSVALMSERHGQKMRITAQRVMLNVNNDQFIVENAEGMESSRIRIAPVGFATSIQPAYELIEESENMDESRSMRHEWRRQGGAVPPTNLTPIRVYGGVAP